MKKKKKKLQEPEGGCFISPHTFWVLKEGEEGWTRRRVRWSGRICSADWELIFTHINPLKYVRGASLNRPILSMWHKKNITN